MEDYTGRTAQAEWRFDSEESKLIFQFKEEGIAYLEARDLETAYWKFRSLWREIDAKLSDKEQKEASEKIKELDTKRQNWLTKYDILSKEDIKDIEGEFYVNLEDFYIYICRLMKKHGLYFKEGEDPGLAMIN